MPSTSTGLTLSKSFAPEIDVHGVKVSFKRRDARLLNDEEYRDLERFVEAEQRYEKGRLEAVMIETNDVLGRVRYVTTTRHEGTDEPESS